MPMFRSQSRCQEPAQGADAHLIQSFSDLAKTQQRAAPPYLACPFPGLVEAFDTI